MTIAIIGTGNVGGALAHAFAGLGHTIRLGARDTAGARPLADAVGASVHAPAGAAHGADLVVLAVPGGAAVEAASALGDLGGAVLLDTTNAVGPRLTYAAAGGPSQAERIADAAPTARVVKGFHTLAAEHMGDGRMGGPRVALFLAGDDADAVAAVAGLAEALHFEPVVVGPLAAARLTEPLALVWITLMAQRGYGRDFGFALVRP